MRLSDHERSQDTVTITADQWNKLVELLTPGYELALMYKAQMQAAQKQPDPQPPAPVDLAPTNPDQAALDTITLG